MVGESGFDVAWSAVGDTRAEVVGHSGVDVSAHTADRRVNARFRGLAPGRTYRYRISADGRTLAEHDARTAPPAGTPFRFVALGDSGSAGKEQFAIAARMADAKPDLIIHTGDLIYPKGLPSEYDRKFYRPYQVMIVSIAFYPCIGNHDYSADEGRPMLDEFVLPENGPAGETPERHYWFDYSHVRFVAIDSNIPRQRLADVVTPWLDGVLAEADRRGLAKVVFFHHPPYSSGPYGGTHRMRLTIVPALERRRAELVLNGHNHAYERTHPLRGGAIVAANEGTVYITTGAGGGELYEPAAKPEPELAKSHYGKHSFTVVDVDATRMVVRQINIEGAVVDEFDIPLRAAATSRPAA